MANGTGGGVLNWAAQNSLIFASEEDGWQHLYTISAEGGSAKILTPGNCEVEQWSFSQDKENDPIQFELWGYRSSPYVANGLSREGPAATNSGRRSIGAIEWGGVITGDGPYSPISDLGCTSCVGRI